jgi:predicted nucleotidyltransferase
MESELKQAVQAVADAAKSLKLDVALVGALMAEFTPEMGSDYPRFRRTNDADFGVYVRDWLTYKKLRDELLRRGFESNSRIEHRLHQGTAMVDLIPYGPRIAPDGKIAWPQSGFEMRVTGFDEVCAAARAAAPTNGLSVPVITVPGFVLLKAMAYLDRKEQGDAKHKDDASDIEYWLRNYASGVEDGRRFDLAQKSDFALVDYETAGAVLLGIEVGALASVEAAACVNRFLSESTDLYSPFMDALASISIDEASKKKRSEGLSLLAAFKKGYLYQRQQKK